MLAAVLGPGRALRAWRRSRPFWGGLLLVLAGVELLFLPLFDVIMRGALGMVMHMGVGGYAGILLGCMLVGCGLGAWLQPVHRTFYAVLGAVAAVASLPASNMGGFFLAMLLGVVGASLVFGWVPSATDPGPDTPDPPATEADEDSGLDLVLSQETTGRGQPEARRPVPGSRAHRASALLLPLLLASPIALGEDLECTLDSCALVGDEPTPDTTAALEPATEETRETWSSEALRWLTSQGEPQQRAKRVVAAGLTGERELTTGEYSLWKDVVRHLGPPPGGDSALPPPPTAVTLPAPSLELPPEPPDLPDLPDLPEPDVVPPDLKLPAEPIPGLPGVPPRLPEFELPGMPSLPPGTEPTLPPLLAEGGRSPELNDPRAKAAPGLRAYRNKVVLRAGTVRVEAFAYEGVAEVPSADGGEVEMMKFTADSFTASDGVAGTITGPGSSTAMESSALEFGGSIEIYATEFSGVLMGVPVRLTPDSAEARMLQLFNTLTPRMPVEMTDVVALQPILLADRMKGRISLAAS